MGDFMANYGIILTYILLAAAAIAAIAFPIMHLVANPKKANDKLSWKANTNIDQLIEIMYKNDFNFSKKK